MVSNELLKIFKVKTIFIPFIFIFIVSLFIGYSSYQEINVNKKGINENWKQELLNQNNNDQELINELSKTGDTKSIEKIKVDIMKNEYYIKHDIKPTNNSTLWGFIEKTTTILSFIQIVVMIYASSMVSKEYNWGTIKFLMIRPVTRVQFLTSKYISLLIFSIILYCSLFVVSLVIGTIIFGIDLSHLVTLKLSDGKIIEVNVLSQILFKYSCAFLELIVYSTIAFMISTILKSNGAAIGSSIFIATSGGIIAAAFSKYEWSKYLLFTNTNLSMYDKGNVLVNNTTFNFSVTVMIVYTFIFLLITFLTFNKRDVV